MKKASKKLANRPAKPKPALKAISKEGSIFDGVSCYVLSNGKRVITKRSMVSALSGGTESGDLERYIERLPNGSALLSTGPNIEFQLPTNGTAHGIDAETIARMLRLYAEAWGTGALRANQIPVAQRAIMMLSQFAEIGIMALVDEATGYQSVRPKDELQRRLLGMIRAERDEVDPVYKPLLVALAKLRGTTRCAYDGTGTPPAWAPLVANICKSCVWDDAGMAKFRALNPVPSWSSRDTQHLDSDGKKLLLKVIASAEVFAFDSRDFDHWHGRMRAYFKGIPLQQWIF